MSASQRPRLSQTPRSPSCSSLSSRGEALSARGMLSVVGLMQHSSVFRARELKPVLRPSVPASLASSPRVSQQLIGVQSAGGDPPSRRQSPICVRKSTRRSTGALGQPRSSPVASPSPSRNRASGRIGVGPSLLGSCSPGGLAAAPGFGSRRRVTAEREQLQQRPKAGASQPTRSATIVSSSSTNSATSTGVARCADPGEKSVTASWGTTLSLQGLDQPGSGGVDELKWGHQQRSKQVSFTTPSRKPRGPEQPIPARGKRKAQELASVCKAISDFLRDQGLAGAADAVLSQCSARLADLEQRSRRGGVPSAADVVGHGGGSLVPQLMRLRGILGQLASGACDAFPEQLPVPPPPWKIRLEAACEDDLCREGPNAEASHEASIARSSEMQAAGLCLPAEGAAVAPKLKQSDSYLASRPAWEDPGGLYIPDEYRDDADRGFRIRELLEEDFASEFQAYGAEVTLFDAALPPMSPLSTRDEAFGSYDDELVEAISVEGARLADQALPKLHLEQQHQQQQQQAQPELLDSQNLLPPPQQKQQSFILTQSNSPENSPIGEARPLRSATNGIHGWFPDGSAIEKATPLTADIEVLGGSEENQQPAQLVSNGADDHDNQPTEPSLGTQDSPAVIWPGLAAVIPATSHALQHYPDELREDYAPDNPAAQDLQAKGISAWPSIDIKETHSRAAEEARDDAQQLPNVMAHQAESLQPLQASPHVLAGKRRSRILVGPRPQIRHRLSDDAFYPVQLDGVVYDSFPLKIVYERECTGFEESKEFPIEINSIIAGRYQVLAYLGSAAFSRAVQCVDLETNMMVCMKIIKNDKDFLDQSLDEIKLLTLLGTNCDDVDEKHCLRLFDFFYHKEHLIIVTELLRDNLYEFSKFNRECGAEPYFTLGRLQKISKQVLIALEYIHSLWLIHADLKPENILVKSYSRCEVKVIDFGSSCFLDDHLSSYVQSRSYRAPEVILGLSYDSKIDLWSLGCIVAELWTGFVLFQNDCVQALLARMHGIIGPFPQHMLSAGKHVAKLFTQDGQLFREIEDEPQRRFIIYMPKQTSLRQRLRTSDELFIKFLESLLTLDPARRPSASSMLRHPWLSPGLYPDGL